MFGFLKKKEPPGRKELREEFEKFTSALRRADDVTQIAVGHSINMANGMFIERFGSIKAFCQQPTNKRIEFIQSLTAFEEKMSQQDPSAALGFSLFKKWVVVLSENDLVLMAQFLQEIGYFSRKGNLFASTNTQSSVPPHPNAQNLQKEFEEKSAPYFIFSEALQQGQRAGHKMADEKFWLWLRNEIGDEVCDMTRNVMNHIGKSLFHDDAADEMPKLTLAELDDFANGLIETIRAETFAR